MRRLHLFTGGVFAFKGKEAVDVDGSEISRMGHVLRSKHLVLLLSSLFESHADDPIHRDRLSIVHGGVKSILPHSSNRTFV